MDDILSLFRVPLTSTSEPLTPEVSVPLGSIVIDGMHYSGIRMMRKTRDVLEIRDPDGTWKELVLSTA